MKRGPARDLADDYHGRIRHYRPLELVDIPEKGDADQALRAAIPDGAVVVVMDERGKHLDSRKFADWLDELQNRGTRHVVFLIGGPDGHDDQTRSRADLILALSAFTLPHDLARAMLAEQVYRAFTIIRNEPYHR